MKAFPRRWLGCVAALAILGAAANAQGQLPADPKPVVTGPARNEQTQLFRGLLHHFKLQPLDPRDMAYNADTIVIVLGDPGRNKASAAGHVRKILASGGAALVAVDTKLDLSPFFPDGEDLEILGTQVADPDGFHAYGRNALCPFAVPYSLDAGRLSPEEQLFAEFPKLATNSPSALRITRRPPYLRRTVAVFDPSAKFMAGERFGPLKRNDFFAAAGVGRENETYRCLVMADPSVLSNDMLYSSGDKDRLNDFSKGDTFVPATDNFPFAVKLVPWLQGPEQRKFCLFIENGEVQTRFDEFDFAGVQGPSPKPQMPPIPPLRLPDPMDRNVQERASKAASEVLTKVEDDDSFKNELARNPKLYIAIVSIVATALLILASILLRGRIWKTRQERNYQPIPVDPLRLGNDVPLGSFTHRRLELLRGSDFRAPFCEYVQLLFAERGYPEGYRGDRCPKIETSSRNRQYLIDSVRRLWTEAVGQAELPMPYTKWKELEPILAAIRSAAEADRWRFAPSPAVRTDSEGAA